jgi:hypothetical protein
VKSSQMKKNEFRVHFYEIKYKINVAETSKDQCELQVSILLSRMASKMVFSLHCTVFGRFHSSQSPAATLIFVLQESPDQTFRRVLPQCRLQACSDRAHTERSHRRDRAATLQDCGIPQPPTSHRSGSSRRRLHRGQDTRRHLVATYFSFQQRLEPSYGLRVLEEECTRRSRARARRRGPDARPTRTTLSRGPPRRACRGSPPAGRRGAT